MKYTRLSLQDLKDLEKEFIDFLAVNGIPADEWERLKAEEKDTVEGIIDQFSDVVWEGVLRKTKRVEHRRKDKLTICRIKNDELQTLVIKTDDENIDLTQPEEIEKLLAHPKNFKIRLQQDAVLKNASEQYFELLKVGFYISKNEAYDQLFEVN
ncbi:hypothetical protein CW751_04805 [Brumimicrobium salinarum]|uniref:Uncharacterized protein n=1 Tax=Brumimicrobium salinarum TaxID=2058658 RepID=A0A2I0R4A3_9FLAO|nr:DUF6495 family protein [Brumimicrobium salinarum]PKR81379.1 hypothetical protein CW751_04805 [Brumimicrobium salinarum]